MAVPVFYASSGLPRLVLLCGAGICFVLASCQTNEASPPSTQVKKEGEQTKPGSSAASNVVSASDVSEKVVAIKELGGRPDTIVSITYRANQHSNGTCALQIVEAGMVVAENREMIECGMLASPAMVDVTLSGTTKNLTIFQQKAKQTNSYSLKRTVDGEWILTKAEFVYPQDNADTGEVEVIRETADLTGLRPPMHVSRFDRDVIGGRVVKSTIE